MGEREIKVGQVWRNCIAEVEVTFRDVSYYYPKIRTTFSGGLTDEMDERVFRATHEWVRDPKPEIKEGDWVVSKQGGRPREVTAVVPIGSNGNVHLAAFGINESVGLRGFWGRYEPCDPPPLHKALRGLVEARRVTGPSSHEMSSQFVAAAIKVAELYENGER